MSDEQFIAWWNSNWPDLAPTHQALHAWLAAREMLDERIAKAREILRELALPDQYGFYIVTSPEHYRKDMQRALEALEGK